MAQPQVITYAYIRGRWYAFPDVNSAREGVVKYNGNYQSIRTSRPMGAVIDEETLLNKNFWPPSLANAPGVTGSALINPPYNPIQGATPVTPVTPVTAETPVTTTTSSPRVTSSASRSTGGDGEQATDYYGGPKRTTGKEFLHGTNIRVSDVNANLRSNSGDAVYWDERLKNTDDPNDVLFEMAFRMGDRSKMTDTGQGNPFVGKLQSGQYRRTTGPTWAQEAVAGDSGATDVYRQRHGDDDKVTGFTTGSEFAQQFKHGEWKAGDFGKTQKKKDDAQAWRDRHLLHAESGLGNYAGLNAQEKTDKQNKIKARYQRMIRGNR